MKATKHVVLTLAALSASITVALASPAMTVTPSTVSITYVKGTGPGAAQNVVVKAVTGSIYFTVDSSLPDWLMVTPVNGTPTATSGTTVAFSASPFVANMGAGVYTATVPFHQGSPDNRHTHGEQRSRDNRTAGEPEPQLDGNAWSRAANGLAAAGIHRRPGHLQLDSHIHESIVSLVYGEHPKSRCILMGHNRDL